MAATVYSDLFDQTTTWPIANYPQRQPYGETVVTGTKTLATTSLDTTADVAHMVPVPGGVTLNAVIPKYATAFDSSTGLDADIVLIDDNGTTILYNAGAGFQTAAPNGTPVFLNVDVASANNDAKVSFLVNTAATTAVSASLALQVRYSGSSI